MFQLVRQGKVQYIAREEEGTMVTTMPLTHTRKGAKKLIKFLKRPDLSPAKIGSMEGETIELVVEHALFGEGPRCDKVDILFGWTNKGEPKFAPFADKDQDKDGNPQILKYDIAEKPESIS
jgi:hypothetical protein